MALVNTISNYYVVMRVFSVLLPVYYIMTRNDVSAMQPVSGDSIARELGHGPD